MASGQPSDAAEAKSLRGIFPQKLVAFSLQ